MLMSLQACFGISMCTSRLQILRRSTHHSSHPQANYPPQKLDGIRTPGGIPRATASTWSVRKPRRCCLLAQVSLPIVISLLQRYDYAFSLPTTLA